MHWAWLGHGQDSQGASRQPGCSLQAGIRVGSCVCRGPCGAAWRPELPQSVKVAAGNASERAQCHAILLEREKKNLMMKKYF